MSLGYDKTSTGFRVLITAALKIRISIDVEFDEEKYLKKRLCAHSNQQHLNLFPNFPFEKEQAALKIGTLVPFVVCRSSFLPFVESITADFDGLGGWISDSVCLSSLIVADKIHLMLYLRYRNVGHATENS